MIRTVIVIVMAMTLTALGIVSATADTRTQDFDAAQTYKGKCVSCHGPKAEKKFDVAKSDEELLQAILKGKKAEKPPNMPEYASKGITADQAKTLLDYMKSLRQ